MKPAEHFVTLPSLERLQLQGSYGKRRRKDVAAIIAYLPQCCLAIHDLRIQITIHPLHPRHRFAEIICRKVSLSDHDVHTDLFRTGNSEAMVPFMLGHDDGVSKLAQLPGVTGCRLDCLQNCVKTSRYNLSCLGCISPSLPCQFVTGKLYGP